MKQGIDLFEVLMFAMIGVVAFWWVAQVNASDQRLIESCKADILCKNPFTGERFGDND